MSDLVRFLAYLIPHFQFEQPQFAPPPVFGLAMSKPWST
jgi:hypothetical protein